MTNKKQANIVFEEGSGNVYADLELEDADELFARAQIGFCLFKILEARKLKQREIATLLGIAQSDVSHLMNGHFSRFTIDKLLNFLKRLDQQVTIQIHPQQAEKQYDTANVQMVKRDGDRKDETPTPPAIIRAIEEYSRLGKSEHWIYARLHADLQYKRFLQAFQQALHVKPSAFHFAHITDTLRKGLWDQTTNQIRAKLRLRKEDNLRDSETELGLVYEMIVQLIAEYDLRQYHDLDYKEAEEIVLADAELIGRQLRKTRTHLRINVQTGKPHLPPRTKRS